MGRGNFLRLMAAEAKNNTIVHAGDWYEMGPRDEMMNLAREFRYPLTEAGFEVLCETGKNIGFKDVRQCVLESKQQGQKKVRPLHSATPKPLSLAKRMESNGMNAEGQLSKEATAVAGQM